ncbi:MAG: type II toxin-antitoxin system VapC family toxin [Planctomycetes bacterium]|nr:type II toxin-antitoxin system VapC family toxin [Planctomycetota bacterium]
MSGRYLLDTNIVIALFAAEATVADRLREAEEVFLASVVLGELYYGACKSARVADNTARIDEFAANSVVLNCDTETARLYAQIKDGLRQKGHPIPENDIWVAAIALQSKLTVATRDVHFCEVDELDVQLW